MSEEAGLRSSFSVANPTVGKFTAANVSFVSNVTISSTSRIVVTLPGMSTCTDGYGNTGSSIVQHLVVQRIHVFNADGSDAVAAVTVGATKQVGSTDSDGLCTSNPSTACYSRCKAIDNDYGVVGPFSNVLELMPGFEIPANKLVVIEMAQVTLDPKP